MINQQQQLGYTQNFLKSRELVSKLVKLARLDAQLPILEVGPGKGIITSELAQRGRVVAVEVDDKLVQPLQTRFAAEQNVEIVQADILAFDLDRLGERYAVFSNIPFNITSLLLEKLLSPIDGAERAFLILQRDALVGRDRDGHATETFKSLLINPFYTVQDIYRFSRFDFKPAPSVETSLFAFEKRREPLVSVESYDLYKDFLAFVTKDRVGEGNWVKLFGKRRMAKVVEQVGLIANRGMKGQSAEAILAAFNHFTTLPSDRKRIVSGEMTNLRAEQARKDQKNRTQGHHRTKKKSSQKSRRRR